MALTYQLNIAFRECGGDDTVSAVIEMPLGEFLFTRLMFFGILPPRDILNTTLSSGEHLDTGHHRLEWPPLMLDEHDYLRLRQDIEMHPEWGGQIDDSFRASAVGDWFHWAMMRSLGVSPRLR